jgi:hypothetical protein
MKKFGLKFVITLSLLSFYGCAPPVVVKTPPAKNTTVVVPATPGPNDGYYEPGPDGYGGPGPSGPGPNDDYEDERNGGGPGPNNSY